MIDKIKAEIKRLEKEKEDIKPEKGSGGHVKNQVRLNKRRRKHEIIALKKCLEWAEETEAEIKEKLYDIQGNDGDAELAVISKAFHGEAHKAGSASK